MKDPEEPFADQLEWQRHRYDPGHFLGGTLRPEYRPSLGIRAKRVVAVMLVAQGLAFLGNLVASSLVAGFLIPDPWTSSLGVISIAGGVKVWRSASRVVPPTREEANEAAGRLYRVAAMVLLAGLFTSLLVLLLVGVVGVLAAALKGYVGFVAALGVLVAVALLIRPNADSDGEDDSSG